MRKTGLEFGRGTTEACKKVIAQLGLQPGEILQQYRAARDIAKTGDLVLQVSDSDPSAIKAEPRLECVRRLKQIYGSRPIPLLMRRIEESAHKVVEMPFEAEAMWFIVHRGQKDAPVMCVIYAVSYDVQAAAEA